MDINQGKKINYFSYNFNENSPNGIEKIENDDNLNIGLKNNENSSDTNNILIISEADLEIHLNLIDIIIEMELVFYYF